MQNQFCKTNTRQDFQLQTRAASQKCQKCGLDKICNTCCLQNHIAQVRRKAKSNTQRNSSSNSNALDNSDNSFQNEKTFNAIIDRNYNGEFDSDYSSTDDNMFASMTKTSFQIEP